MKNGITSTIKQRIDALDLQHQLIFYDDIEEAMLRRLDVLERDQKKA